MTRGNSENPCLGVDFGRVIQGAPDPDGGGADTFFLDAAIADAVGSPATPGMFEVLPGLVAAFAGRAWIISKCGPAVAAKTLAWLDYQDFYRRTGLPRGNVRFCRARADKARHCRELAITHMIDDRLDVHAALRDVVPHRYLFGPQTGPVPDWVVHTPSWPSTAAAVTRSLP